MQDTNDKARGAEHTGLRCLLRFFCKSEAMLKNTSAGWFLVKLNNWKNMYIQVVALLNAKGKRAGLQNIIWLHIATEWTTMEKEHLTTMSYLTMLLVAAGITLIMGNTKRNE